MELEALLDLLRAKGVRVADGYFDAEQKYPLHFEFHGEDTTIRVGRVSTKDDTDKTDERAMPTRAELTALAGKLAPPPVAGSPLDRKEP